MKGNLHFFIEKEGFWKQIMNCSYNYISCDISNNNLFSSTKSPKLLLRSEIDILN